MLHSTRQIGDMAVPYLTNQLLQEQDNTKGTMRHVPGENTMETPNKIGPSAAALPHSTATGKLDFVE